MNIWRVALYYLLDQSLLRGFVLFGHFDLSSCGSGLLFLFLFELLFDVWILAELAEEVAQNESCKTVEEKNLAHEPEVCIRHFQVAVV